MIITKTKLLKSKRKLIIISSLPFILIFLLSLNTCKDETTLRYNHYSYKNNDFSNMKYNIDKVSASKISKTPTNPDKQNLKKISFNSSSDYEPLYKQNITDNNIPKEDNRDLAITDPEVSDTEDEDSEVSNTVSIESQLLAIINNIRANEGLDPFNKNTALDIIAEARSNDMISRNYFSHNTPEGKNIFHILQENNVMYAEAGENIQYSSPPDLGTPQVIVDSWMQSNTHRQNLLSGSFSQIGIGIVDGNNKRIAVLVFLR